MLALVGSLVGTFGGIMTGNKLTIYRLEQLEKKVSEHNNLIIRTYEAEKKIALIEKEVQEIEEKSKL